MTDTEALAIEAFVVIWHHLVLGLLRVEGPFPSYFAALEHHHEYSGGEYLGYVVLLHPPPATEEVR